MNSGECDTHSISSTGDMREAIKQLNLDSEQRSRAPSIEVMENTSEVSGENSNDSKKSVFKLEDGEEMIVFRIKRKFKCPNCGFKEKGSHSLSPIGKGHCRGRNGGRGRCFKRMMKFHHGMMHQFHDNMEKRNKKHGKHGKCKGKKHEKYSEDFTFENHPHFGHHSDFHGPPNHPPHSFLPPPYGGWMPGWPDVQYNHIENPEPEVITIPEEDGSKKPEVSESGDKQNGDVQMNGNDDAIDGVPFEDDDESDSDDEATFPIPPYMLPGIFGHRGRGRGMRGAFRGRFGPQFDHFGQRNFWM